MNNITLQEYQSAYYKIKPYIKNTKFTLRNLFN